MALPSLLSYTILFNFIAFVVDLRAFSSLEKFAFLVYGLVVWNTENHSNFGIVIQL